MKILIVHDRSEVGNVLATIARDTLGPSGSVDTADDVMSARDLLQDYFYDLMVIDLTLPFVNGKGEATLENTTYLLDFVFDGDGKAPGDILGISLEADVLNSVKSSIGNNIMACLYEDREGRWKSAFSAKIDYVRKARRARQLVMNSSHDVDAVILTALDKEAAPYQNLFELADSDDFPRAKEFAFRSHDGAMRRGILYSIGQSGQAPTGSAAQALLSQFRPRVMLMTGFCGGVEERVSLGDLVAFKSSSAWDYGKWVQTKDNDGRTQSTFKARPAPINVQDQGLTMVVRDVIAADPKRDATLEADLVKVSSGKHVSWHIRQAAAASGSAVVTSLDKIGEIVALDENIWAIDMESYAFYFACRNSPVIMPDFMCIKAVADYCNGDKTSKYHGVCSAISARFAYDLLTRHHNF